MIYLSKEEETKVRYRRIKYAKCDCCKQIINLGDNYFQIEQETYSEIGNDRDCYDLCKHCVGDAMVGNIGAMSNFDTLYIECVKLRDANIEEDAYGRYVIVGE